MVLFLSDSRVAHIKRLDASSSVLFPPSQDLLVSTLTRLSVLDSEQIMVLVACGPYTTSDSIAFEPLLDLITVINRDRPDVCILVGALLRRLHLGRLQPGNWGVGLRTRSDAVLN